MSLTTVSVLNSKKTAANKDIASVNSNLGFNINFSRSVGDWCSNIETYASDTMTGKRISKEMEKKSELVQSLLDKVSKYNISDIDYSTSFSRSVNISD